MSTKWYLVVILFIALAVVSLACQPPAPKDAKTGDKVTEVKPPEPAPVEVTKVPEPVAVDFASAKKGFDAFKDPKLAGGTANLSCNSCHPWGGKDTSKAPKTKGTLIGSAASFPKVVEMVGKDKITLVDMINFCITMPLKGKALAPEDPIMKELVDYVTLLKPMTFETDALPVFKTACANCHTGAKPTTGKSWEDKALAVKSASAIRTRVDAGQMPPAPGKLADKDFLTLLIWATNEIDGPAKPAAPPAKPAATPATPAKPTK